LPPPNTRISFERPVTIDDAEIAGAEPAVRRKRATIDLGVSDIAARDRTAAQLDLADTAFVRVRNTNFAAGKRLSGAPETTLTGPIAGE
jgi:hypothetical protein